MFSVLSQTSIAMAYSNNDRVQINNKYYIVLFMVYNIIIVLRYCCLPSPLYYDTTCTTTETSLDFRKPLFHQERRYNGTHFGQGLWVQIQ